MRLPTLLCYHDQITGSFVSEFCSGEIDSSAVSKKRVGSRQPEWSQDDLSPGSCQKLRTMYPLDFANYERCERLL